MLCPKCKVEHERDSNYCNQCGSPLARKGEGSNSSSLIITEGVGVGNIKLGYKVSMVEEILGKAEESRSYGTMYLSYYSLGIEIECLEDKVILIECRDNDEKCKAFGGKTMKGISIGDSEERVLSVYGNPNEIINTYDIYANIMKGKAETEKLRAIAPSATEKTLKVWEYLERRFAHIRKSLYYSGIGFGLDQDQKVCSIQVYLQYHSKS